MRDGPLPEWMDHAIPAAAIVGLLLVVLVLLSGCVTLHDCRARINGAVQLGCQWAFSAAP